MQATIFCCCVGSISTTDTFIRLFLGANNKKEHYSHIHIHIHISLPTTIHNFYNSSVTQIYRKTVGPHMHHGVLYTVLFTCRLMTVYL
jgi:hypothetical protein